MICKNCGRLCEHRDQTTVCPCYHKNNEIQEKVAELRDNLSKAFSEKVEAPDPEIQKTVYEINAAVSIYEATGKVMPIPSCPSLTPEETVMDLPILKDGVETGGKIPYRIRLIGAEIAPGGKGISLHHVALPVANQITFTTYVEPEE